MTSAVALSDDRLFQMGPRNIVIYSSYQTIATMHCTLNLTQWLASGPFIDSCNNHHIPIDQATQVMMGCQYWLFFHKLIIFDSFVCFVKKAFRLNMYLNDA